VNIFITGATGFVGSHLIRRLSETEHQLTCLVRDSSETDQFRGINATLVYGDVRDRYSLIKGIINCQWIVHLASVYSFWEPDPGIYHDVNVVGTRNVMECALKANVAKVVHLSTYGAFGIQTKYPFTEQDAPNPIQSCRYSKSKYLSDLIVWELHASQGLPITVLYPANILGSGDDKATSLYIQNIISRKLPFRVLEDHSISCVHVNDVVEAIILSLECRQTTGERFILADSFFTFREFNEMISEISGVSLPRMSLPDNIVVGLARIFTLFSDIFKLPPLYGLSRDQVSAMMSDARCTGKKAERELGIKYTPTKIALQEAINTYRHQ
jgi:dihydroflavonol-4-reductase